MSKTRKISSHQLELDFTRPLEADRNAKFGGRSFYFFDLDDNVLHLPSPIYVFHRETGEERALSSGEFAHQKHLIGQPGPLQDFVLKFEDDKSFRRFRDWKGLNVFEEDVRSALKNPDFQWKGPSWDFFYHAVYNKRPMTIITARGHDPSYIKMGLRVLVEAGFLPHEPEFMGIYPVSNKGTRAQLGDLSEKWNVPELKKYAIFDSVLSAMKLFGENQYHRFGMSDDDAHNIELITAAMKELKKRYPGNSFFVINSNTRPVVKWEVHLESLEAVPTTRDQMDLFA